MMEHAQVHDDEVIEVAEPSVHRHGRAAGVAFEPRGGVPGVQWRAQFPRGTDCMETRTPLEILADVGDPAYDQIDLEESHQLAALSEPWATINYQGVPFEGFDVIFEDLG